MRDIQDIFDRSYADYADAIFRHCAFRLMNRERGKDLMQEAFLRLWVELGKGVEVLNMRAFLYRIANNLIIDDVRKKKEMSLDELQETGWDKGEDKTQEMQSRVLFHDILATLKSMKPDDRELIVMRYIDGLTPADIAEVLSEAPNTVSVRLHRAVKELRSLMRSPQTSNFGSIDISVVLQQSS
ncbi:MAG: RNA polymerase sigma factor [Candidatus Peribacteraceae bacterium]|nr:RNA polymerase sigma factor [Candidatus Peribacteraceae bacterium]